MKKIHSKLSLRSETLRNLSGTDIKEAAGGFVTQFCSGGSSCCTDTCGNVCTKVGC